MPYQLALTLPLLLVASLTILVSCSMTTRTTAPIAVAEQKIVKRICTEAWLPQSYDSEHDTAETVDEAKAGNRSREAFCK